MKSESHQPDALAEFFQDITDTVRAETEPPMTNYLLIAQNADGYEPVAIVIEAEADEFARQDMASRRPESDDFRPEEYALWKQQPDGRYAVARIITL